MDNVSLGSKEPESTTYDEAVQQDQQDLAADALSDSVALAFESAAALQAAVAIREEPELPDEIKQAVIATGASGMGLGPNDLAEEPMKVKPILTMLGSDDQLRSVFDASVSTLGALLDNVDHMVNITYQPYIENVKKFGQQVKQLKKRAYVTDGSWTDVPPSWSYLAADAKPLVSIEQISAHSSAINSASENIAKLTENIAVGLQALPNYDTDLDKVEAHLLKSYLAYAKAGLFTENDEGVWLAANAVVSSNLYGEGLDKALESTYFGIRPIPFPVKADYPVLDRWQNLCGALDTLDQVLIDCVYRYRVLNVRKKMRLTRELLNTFVNRTGEVTEESIRRLVLLRNTIISSLVLPARFLHALVYTVRGYVDYTSAYLKLEYTDGEQP